MKRDFLQRCVGLGLLAVTKVGHANGGNGSSQNDLDVTVRIRELLLAYAANKPEQVIAMLNPEGWVVIGSDVAEIVRTNSALLEMMRADFALWTTAEFSAIRDVDIRTDGVLASAMFHVDFSAGGRPSLPVRFCTTWHKISGKWMLTQCANAAPTVHSSALELLKR